MGIKFRAASLVMVLSIIAILTLGAVPTVDHPDAWKGLSAEQVKKVMAGEVVLLNEDTSKGEEDQKRFIYAAMIFDQPIEQVWKLHIDVDKQYRYLPDLVASPLVDKERCDFHVKIMMINIYYRVKYNFDKENYKFSWSLDPSYDNDMKRVDGFWELYKIDDKRTLGRYGTNIEVTSLIPEFIMDKLTRSNLPTTMDGCYKYIQSGGKWTKPGFKENK